MCSIISSRNGGLQFCSVYMRAKNIFDQLRNIDLFWEELLNFRRTAYRRNRLIAETMALHLHCYFVGAQTNTIQLKLSNLLLKTFFEKDCMLKKNPNRYQVYTFRLL